MTAPQHELVGLQLPPSEPVLVSQEPATLTACR
jgi:hypothetical protein